MRKAISFFLTCSIILSCAPTVFAANSEPTAPLTAPDTISAMLINEDGEAVEIIGQKLEANPSTPCMASPASLPQPQSTIYEFEITRAALETGDTSRQGTDGSVSVRINARIFYNIDNTTGVPKYCLTRATGNWTILDSSVTVTNASVKVNCYDSFVSWQTATYDDVSNYYSIYTGFTNYVPNNPPYSMVGSQTTVDLKMTKGNSTRTWSFTLNCTL